MYSFLIKQIENHIKNTLIDNYKNILIMMIPVIPHFSNECLNLLKNTEVKWPKINPQMLEENMVNIVIQINGKKRELIQINGKISEEELLDKIKINKNLFKYLQDKEIKRKIYIPNKLINIII